MVHERRVNVTFVTGYTTLLGYTRVYWKAKKYTDKGETRKHHVLGSSKVFKLSLIIKRPKKLSYYIIRKSSHKYAAG